MLLGLLADHWQRKFFLTLVIADEAATTISEFDQDLYIARIKGSRSCCKDYNSFGMPDRKYINATYIAMAIRAGLPCPITNPYRLKSKQPYWLPTFQWDAMSMAWVGSELIANVKRKKYCREQVITQNMPIVILTHQVFQH